MNAPLKLPILTLADLELEERRAEARRFDAVNRGSQRSAAHFQMQLAILSLAKIGITAKEKTDA